MAAVLDCLAGFFATASIASAPRAIDDLQAANKRAVRPTTLRSHRHCLRGSHKRDTLDYVVTTFDGDRTVTELVVQVTGWRR